MDTIAIVITLPSSLAEPEEIRLATVCFLRELNKTPSYNAYRSLLKIMRFLLCGFDSLTLLPPWQQNRLAISKSHERTTRFHWQSKMLHGARRLVIELLA